MTTAYVPQEFEDSWQVYWEKNKIYQTPSQPRPEKKRYVLAMFPYPSGSGLHVGHVRIYTGTDVLARYLRMKGYDVLHPMGFDAFGLPAENAAIKAKKNPMEMVPQNIINFKKQMQRLGLSYDWQRQLSTTDPQYYRHTQELFLQFFRLGLLYKKNTPVYYCDSCRTGLAEEEVLANGTHERCGKPITRKNLPQWLFKITDYSDSLLSTLKDLNWPNGILQMQKNWIGKDKGLNIHFTDKHTKEPITVWTRFWETLFGVTFLVMAPEHSWVSEGLAKKRFPKAVNDYVEQALRKTDEQRLKEEKAKTGVFTGCYAINPVNGQTVPIWVADYVLSNVGTAAVMGVPAHDERDLAFAKKYQLPVIEVIKNDKIINSDQFNHLSASGAGKQKMAQWLIDQKLALWQINYHLRDWIFSRQRYWGEPIPMVYCKVCAEQKKSYFDTEEYEIELEKINKTNPQLYQATLKRLLKFRANLYGWFPIKETELPLELPHLQKYEPSSDGQSPLAKSGDWLKVSCPHCKGPAKRETDTMPNWAGSCWYFLHFAQNHTPGVLRSKAIGNSPYLPVDWYLGGAEHAVLHLLYARFWAHVLNDLKILDFREPFLRLKNVGMVLAEDHRKMSKSVGNVINPDEVVEKYGADSLRLYEMFMAPFSQEIGWSTNNLLGARRFLQKVYQLLNDSAKIAKTAAEEDSTLVAKLQTTIDKVDKDITNVKFNTAISTLMEFVNDWQKTRLAQHNAEKFLKLLAPFAPFMAEQIWQKVFKKTTSIHLEAWPNSITLDDQKLEINLPISINGKIRALLKVDNQIAKNEKQILNLALSHQSIIKYLALQKYRYIYVPGKVLNFIIK